MECTNVESLLVCKLLDGFLCSDPSLYRVNYKFYPYVVAGKFKEKGQLFIRPL